MLETTEHAVWSTPVPAQDKFVTLTDGVKIHYQEAGPTDAPALVMTHGFLGSLRDWHYVTGPLAKLADEKGQSLRTIALDWVGFGQSAMPRVEYSLFYFAESLKQFAEALGLEHFDLMGHSMGGKHNLAFAVLYPQFVRKLILVDTDGFLDDPWWTNQTNKEWFKPLGNLSTNLLGKERFLRLFFHNIFFDPKFYPSAEELHLAALELQNEDYRYILRSLNRDYPQLSLKLTGLRDRLGELREPVQIFWGLQDRILPLEQGHRAHAALPNSRLTVFDQCGHLPQIEKASEFNSKVLDFLHS